MLRQWLLPMSLCLFASPVRAADAEWAELPGDPAFATVLDYNNGAPDQPEQSERGRVPVAAFALQRRPVTNLDFLGFVTRHPQWRRGQVPTVFAEHRYLEHWSGPLSLGSAAGAQQPVTRVSWFAAQAYCETLGARLPTWTEWEYAAAADATRADARTDPAWRERILAWYARPSGQSLPDVGQSPADVHGVQDLHGLVWEWVEDHSAMLVSADNREQGDPDLLRFCGAGALSANDRENYAVLMRVAMLSALEGEDTTANMGFRCARDPDAGLAETAP